MPDKNTVQHIGGIVERETSITDVSQFFLFLQKVKTTLFLCEISILRIQTVEQIDVKIVDAASLALFFKNFFRRFTLCKNTAGQLCGDQIGISRVPFHQCLSQARFAFAVQIGVCRVKVTESPLQKQIHHLYGGFQIDNGTVVGIGVGQP